MFPLLIGLLLSAIVLGMAYCGALIYFGIDERKRREAYQANEAYSALRYIRVSDTVRETAIPSLATMKGKKLHA